MRFVSSSALMAGRGVGGGGSTGAAVYHEVEVLGPPTIVEEKPKVLIESAKMLD